MRKHELLHRSGVGSMGAVGPSKEVGELSLGRNEPCWCGSGKKFKHCHLGREDKRPPHPAEIDRIILESLSH